MESKQVIVVRKDLNMRKGKIAAQVAHASMGVILDLVANGRIVYSKEDCWATQYEDMTSVTEWLNGSFTKIVVSVDSEEELMGLFCLVTNTLVPCKLILDSGLTEFGGKPTFTCMAIGPWYSDRINNFTENLKLL